MSYFPRPVREITTEDKLALVDRMYQPGDLLKRSVDDVRSGIVTGCVLEFIRSLASCFPPVHCLGLCERVSSLRTNQRLVLWRGAPYSTSVKGRLDHAISGEAIPGWKTMDDIESAVEVDMGDYVVHNDWVGQVRTTTS